MSVPAPRQPPVVHNAADHIQLTPPEGPDGFPESQPEPAPRTGLFAFDGVSLRGNVLSHSPSRFEYHEYAVFKASGDGLHPHPHRHICHSVLSDEASGPRHFSLAFRHRHGLNEKGEFKPLDGPSSRYLEGRVRQVICRRDVRSEDGRSDGLFLSQDDFDALDLHPGTLQTANRTTTEFMAWNRAHDKLSLILSFGSKPRPPFDFLSMTYSIPDRTSTILIRQSYNPSKHSYADVPEYQGRMEACRAHWAHPLVTAVVMLQVQFARTEAAIADNTSEVFRLEQDVSGLVGFGAFDARLQARASTMSHGSAGGPSSTPSAEGTPVLGKSTTLLMKRAHDALRRSIRLLDTVRWMDRAVRMLIKAGDEMGDLLADDDDVAPSTPLLSPTLSPGSFTPRTHRYSNVSLRERAVHHPMESHWHEIRQYLEGLLQLCAGLDTDRSMLEVRCKAQIDMIYSKMASEDNTLNAQMAVASTRDSSSMKALAVITAIFLPGEFIGSIFGMSMFDWQDIDADNDGGGGGAEDKHPIVTSRFWIYWAIVIPMSVTILAVWRVWWVIQDRQFRRYLSPELSEQKYWSNTGKPRELESSFWHDFFYLSVRREYKGIVNGEKKNMLSRSTSLSRDSFADPPYENHRSPIVGQTSSFGPPTEPAASRIRQIVFPEAVEKRRHPLDAV